jgi:hypothetical protein
MSDTAALAGAWSKSAIKLLEDLAKQARQYIDANKILNAHKCLLDMEKCRNDILEELGSSNEKNVNVSDIKVKKQIII